MRIGIPVGGFHEGNTGEYVLRALTALGHECSILNHDELLQATSNHRFDLYFGVDSGETLRVAELPSDALRRYAFWFIDYRHNKNRSTRMPTDEENARLIAAGGGWIFQAQFQDVEDCAAHSIHRASWLPMAADEAIWQPRAGQKQFDVAFIGNVWDEGRLQALRGIQESGLKFAALCNGAVWKERAASALCSAKIGFNISSWYGTEFAFDLNMRFFEVLSCGLPIVTNAVPALGRLFREQPPFVRVYSCAEEIVPTLTRALSDPVFLGSGELAREYIIGAGTYRHRMIDALETLRKNLHVG
ncbi:MAG: glycosyltransferase [Bdellovibrionota bacterium]